MPPDPPSYARPRNMIRSDFKLDPPLPVTQLEISNVIVPRISVSKDISDFNIQRVIYGWSKK